MLIMGMIDYKHKMLKAVLENYVDEDVLIVGPMGIYGSFDLEMPSRHKFLRYHSDTEYTCERHPNFAGDFYYDKKLSLLGISCCSIFLSLSQFRTNLANKWIDNRPRIVVSPFLDIDDYQDPHDANKVQHEKNVIKDLMKVHKPEIWISSHNSGISVKNMKRNGITYNVLGKLVCASKLDDFMTIL